MYYIKAVCDSQVHMEQYRSGHNGHDWKSCVPQKGTEGSNPSCSAIENLDRTRFRFSPFILTVLTLRRGDFLLYSQDLKLVVTLYSAHVLYCQKSMRKRQVRVNLSL